MKTFKRIVQIFVLLFFMVLASVGMIAIFPNYRDRYLNNEIKTEQIDKKEDDIDAQADEIKE